MFLFFQWVRQYREVQQLVQHINWKKQSEDKDGSVDMRRDSESSSLELLSVKLLPSICSEFDELCRMMTEFI